MAARIDLLIMLSILATTAQVPETPAAYTARITEWRKTQEAELMKNEGWLAVAGLFWLDEGDNTIGTGPSNKIVLPAGATAVNVGVVTRHGDQVTLKANDPTLVRVDGNPVTTVDMKPDNTRPQLGDLVLIVIRRGKRVGIRLFDINSKERREFVGMKWFPVDPALRVSAKYVAYDTAKTMSITNVLGDTSPVPNPGYVEFTIDGKKCRLEAQAQGEGLFFNFHDQTSGRETYPAGRFLDAPAPKNGFVDLDFNQAVNPPCAFTAFATCPLPPKENFLPVAIRAGEKTHHAGK